MTRLIENDAAPHPAGRTLGGALVALALTLSACSQEAAPTGKPAAGSDAAPAVAEPAPETTAARLAHAGHGSMAARQLDPGYLNAEEGIAPLLEGIGPVNFPISTGVPQAQAYFNQALTFSYGFNHAEAVRSFREAARLDPSCGICWWGIALALGPNINAAMDDAAVAPAWNAVQVAVSLRDKESPVEQALIDAVSTRYSEDGSGRDALDVAYAGSMQAVAQRFPDDTHVQTLYAESLMDLYPWAYWTDDGAPKEHTSELVSVIERVIEKDDSHPGALHLYIHVMERFSPEKAEAAADRLGPLVPVAGHLVHMPSHIYLRVGRYHDAVLANQEAALADEDYLSQCDAQGFYPAGYYPHNIHFLWYAAIMEGRKELAVETARRLYDKVDLEMARQFGSIQRYLGVRGATYVRFGMWEEALAEPEMPEGLPAAAFMRDYAQGVAQAATGDLVAAQATLARMRAQRSDESFDAVMDRQGNIGNLLGDLAIELVEAEIARPQKDSAGEIEHLLAAVAAQDALPYTEPPFWHFPVRQSLGSAYLRSGNAAAAAATFEEDLGNFPNNGWSLHGLHTARSTLGQPTGDLEAALATAWQYSDIEPTSGP